MGLAESRTIRSSESDGSQTTDVEFEDEPDTTEFMLLPQLVDEKKHCDCSNCSEIVSKFSECNICLNPLQNTVVYACNGCGGLWCMQCAAPLKYCPYCRGPLPGKASLALRCMLNNMTLPCRNWRSGCEEFLTASNRLRHESTCEFNQVACDIVPLCSVYLPVSQLSHHMISHHKVTTITDVPFSLQIQHFKLTMACNKMSRSKYRLYLLVHDHIFTVKVSFFNLFLVVYISRKPYKYEVNEKNGIVVERSFCATAEFVSKECRKKVSWIVRDHTPVRKTIVEREMYEKHVWSEEVAHLILNVEPVSSEDVGKMRAKK